jgi:hypothetical protein
VGASFWGVLRQRGHIQAVLGSNTTGWTLSYGPWRSAHPHRQSAPRARPSDGLDQARPAPAAHHGAAASLWPDPDARRSGTGQADGAAGVGGAEDGELIRARLGPPSADLLLRACAGPRRLGCSREWPTESASTARFSKSSPKPSAAQAAVVGAATKLPDPIEQAERFGPSLAGRA